MTSLYHHLLPAAVLLWCASATAQQAVATDAAGAHELPEVVVTAQKTRQPLEQVPASVSAVDGDFIQETGAYDFTELQNYVANTSIQMSPSSSQINVRGLGTTNVDPAADSSVGTVIDGVYYGRPSFLTAFFYDIDRLEVLRGPQGTLFGKNSTAGLLNLVTRAPGQDFSTNWNILHGNNGATSIRPALTLPFGEDLSLRVAGNFSRIDGVFNNTDLGRPENNPRQNSWRVRLRYVPADDWRIDIGGFSSQQRSNFNLYKLTTVGPAMRSLLLSYDPQFNTDIHSRNNSADVPSIERSLDDGANITINHDLDGLWGIREFKLTSISAYGRLRVDNRDLDADFSPAPFIRDTLIRPSPYQQVSEELRFSGSNSSLFGWGHEVQFIGGFYYFDSIFDTSDNFFIEKLSAAASYEAAVQCDEGNLPGCPSSTVGSLVGATLPPLLNTLVNAANTLGVNTSQSAQTDLHQRSHTYALFGQLEHYFAQQWAWIGGMRLGLETRQASASSNSSSVIIQQIAGQQNFTQTINHDEHDISPKAGIKWSPSKITSAYATFTRGLKSGGFNGRPLNPSNLEYGPERAASYEIGAKSRLFGGSMNVSGALFSTKFSDLQVPTYAGVAPQTLNAGSARTQGFEGEMRWLTPLDGVEVDGALGYANAHYLSYTNAPAIPQKAPLQCTFNGTAQGCPPTTQNLSGRPLAFAPRWTASLIPSYTYYIDPYGITATVAMDVLFRDRMYLDAVDNNAEMQPATTLINLRTIFGDPDHSWSVVIGAKNLTNKLILDQYLAQPLAPGNYAVVRTDYGRVYSANLAYAF